MHPRASIVVRRPSEKVDSACASSLIVEPLILLVVSGVSLDYWTWRARKGRNAQWPTRSDVQGGKVPESLLGIRFLVRRCLVANVKTSSHGRRGLVASFWWF